MLHQSTGWCSMQAKPDQKPPGFVTRDGKLLELIGTVRQVRSSGIVVGSDQLRGGCGWLLPTSLEMVRPIIGILIVTGIGPCATSPRLR